MPAPIFRRFTRAVPGALNVFLLATDDITTETSYLLAQQTNLLDIVNDPDPAAGLRYEIRLFKNGIDTGRGWFSTSISPASAGRVAIGPVTMKAGRMAFAIAQRAGALTVYSIVVKLSNP